MRILPVILLAALALPAIAAARYSENAKLAAGGLGGLRIEMTEAQVEKELGREVRQRKNVGLGGSCGIARIDGSNFMFFTNNVLRRVSLYSRQYETRSGLRVGDAQKDIRGVYGKRAKRSEHVYDPGGFYFSVAFGERRRLRFETDGSRITAINAGRTPEVDYVEGCA